MKKIVFIFFVVILSKLSFAQQILTHQQMSEDLDFLVNIIDKVDPEIDVWSKIKGYDVLEKIKSLKNKIPQIQNDSLFVNEIVIPALNLCNNNHIDINHPSYIQMYFDYFKKNDIKYLEKPLKYIDTNFLDQHAKMYKYIYYPKYLRLNKLEYWKGDYYTVSAFKYNGKKYDKGLKVKSINGMHPDTIIEKYSKYERIDIKWDKKLNKLYSNNFYKIKELTNKEINVVLVDGLGNELVINNKNGKLNSGKYITINFPKVHYFHKTKVLYIKLVQMEGKSLVDIVRKYKNKPIEKVVIDIRFNEGGSDLYWVELLKNIFDSTIITQSKMVTKHNEITSDYLSTFYKGNLDNINKIPFLSDANYIIKNHGSDTIVPDEKSIKYKGKIYLICSQFCYSSAMSMLDYAQHCTRFVTVGTPTGFMGGKGTSALMFMLPNSKLIVSIIPNVSVGNAQNVEDMFLTPQIVVDLTLDELLETWSFNGMYLSKKFLKKKDPFFKAVLNN